MAVLLPGGTATGRRSRAAGGNADSTPGASQPRAVGSSARTRSLAGSAVSAGTNTGSGTSCCLPAGAR